MNEGRDTVIWPRHVDFIEVRVFADNMVIKIMFLMQKIFPISVIQNTSEYYQSKISVRSKTIYLATISLLLSVFISLPLITVDVAIQARGAFHTSLARNEITSLVGGRVESVLLQENMSVRKGDVLATLRTETIDREIKSLSEREDQIHSFITDLQKLIRPSPDTINFDATKLTTSIYQAAYLEYQGSLANYQAALNKERRDYDRARFLLESNTIPFAEFDDVQLRYHQAKSNREIFRKRAISGWELELVEYQKELVGLRNQLNLLNERLDQSKIVAGVSGTLIDVRHIGIGDFIYPHQKIGEISPDSTLIAVANLSPADIAFVQKGQKVLLQVDAFNYNQWGFLEGAVWDISDDLSMVSEREVAFKVICTLNHSKLRLKNGLEGEVRKGMTFNGRFVIARRSLFQLLHDKVDDWLNPLVN